MIVELREDVEKNPENKMHLKYSNVKSFLTFADFFENGKNPMFIIDMDTHQYLNVNQQFIDNQHLIGEVLPDFVASIQKKKEIESVQFSQGNQTFLFNPLIQDEGKALIQILKLNVRGHSTPDHNRPLAVHPFVDDKLQAALLNALPSGLIQTDTKFESVWFNSKLKNLFGGEIDKKFNFIESIFIKNISKFWDNIEKIKQEGGWGHFSFAIRTPSQPKEVFIDAKVFAVGKQHGLQEGFIFVLEDKTKNIVLSEKVTKQNLALDKINHELDKFLYSVSHNIRGPIASLEGLLKVIEISDVETVNQLKHHLRLNLRLLNGFVSDISNVATNIHTHVNFSETNLRDLVERIILFVDDIFELKPEVTINIPNDYSIKTDADRFGIVLKSILKNSFQYWDTRKQVLKIEVNVTRNEDFHLIEITDNGIGIADKVKPFIFDMFYRGTELSNGNGMGLYNTREILKKIGGTMNITSKDREYTTAKLYLPINPA